MCKTVTKLSFDVKSVDTYVKFYHSGISVNEHFESVYELVRNLSYSTQYLEFIDSCLKEDLHGSIITHNIKSYIITAIGIVESVLYYFIRSNNIHKTCIYEEHSTFKANDKKVGADTLMVETKFYKRLSCPIPVEMNLDSMLKKAEKNKLLGNDESVYKELKRLRKLRNKVHLHLIEKKLDHDFNNFRRAELKLMKGVLRKLVFADIFTLEKEQKEKQFDFLI